MTEYTVKWVIEVTADNPIEAAMQARMLLLDPESEAVHFEVSRFSGMGEHGTRRAITNVDLSDVDFTKVEV
jgi:hypothetical protein